MGEISGKIADFTFITTDNPRTEEPEEIVKEIEEGMKNKRKIQSSSRQKRSNKRSNRNGKQTRYNSTCRKGHEPYQEINGTKYPFDERIIVKEIIG